MKFPASEISFNEKYDHHHELGGMPSHSLNIYNQNLSSNSPSPEFTTRPPTGEN